MLTTCLIGRGFTASLVLHMRAPSRSCHIELDAALEDEFRAPLLRILFLPTGSCGRSKAWMPAARNSTCCSSTFRSVGSAVTVGGPEEDFDLARPH